MPTFYTLVDESGNLKFSSHGTKYFILSALATKRPFIAAERLNESKYGLWEEGRELEYFHASNNSKQIRSKVFTLIDENVDDLCIDSIIVGKIKLFRRSKRIKANSTQGYLIYL